MDQETANLYIKNFPEDFNKEKVEEFVEEKFT